VGKFAFAAFCRKDHFYLSGKTAANLAKRLQM
jgi:hypothetical protein